MTFPAPNEPIALFVNVDMLEGVGYTLEDLKTWDGMLEAAEAIAAEYDIYGCSTDISFGGGYAEFLWYSNLWSVLRP